MQCLECENVVDNFFDTTMFWLFAPTIEASCKLNRMCRLSNITFSQKSEHCVAIVVKKNHISMILKLISKSLSGTEYVATKAVTTKMKKEPDIRDMERVVTLQKLVSCYKFSQMLENIREKRFESWFQPIVHAEDALCSPSVFGFESLFRLRDRNNKITPPHELFQLADEADVLFQLDLIARRSAVMCAGAAKLPGKLFINFNPSSIYDPSYCLKTTASFIKKLGLTPRDIVFEVTETHRANDVAHLKSILTYYRNAGFEVALDDIGAGWSGLTILQLLHPDYIKIDIELIRGIQLDKPKQSIVFHLIQMAKENDIKVIAEGIETPSEATWLQKGGVDYLQGYLFGKPSPVYSEERQPLPDVI